MRYVVGFRPDERGGDAIALAAVIAKTQGATLDIVFVVGKDAPYVALNPDGNRVDAAEQRVLTAKREAMRLVPVGLPATFHVRSAESLAAGLIEAAREFSARLIVVGAASNGLFKRFTVGSVANALLHASPVPVALAPRGYNRKAALSRLTVMTGTREGWHAVVQVGVHAASRRNVPLRLVSILELDQLEQGEYDLDNPLSPARQHVNTALSEAAAELPEGSVTVTAAHGRTIEEAIDSIGWKAGELVIVGSSRLAEKNKIFLGPTANKILRALPVPMVVVPRDFERLDD
ncbi:universal stress protein [Arthrobacter sp. 35W]|uniref:universal stress protein n=1 Tax=Arthrobacter sp. 35W TaxID=1132441 RepID=UPI0003FEF9C4|nr:universal stress protein [Arthrobacter sp. 35W]